MRSVFVDTGGFVALLVANDAAHARAAELFRQALRERWQLVTTNAVVMETYAVILNRARNGRQVAIAFLDILSAPSLQALTVVRLSKSDEDAAAALVRAHDDKAYSLCDASSFVVMERLGITEAIAFDRHFREYGRFTVYS